MRYECAPSLVSMTLPVLVIFAFFCFPLTMSSKWGSPQVMLHYCLHIMLQLLHKQNFKNIFHKNKFTKTIFIVRAF